MDNNVNDDKNHGEMDEQEQMDVGSIFRCIFNSCDVDHTDMVPVSKLIEFVKPYMFEDLNALQDLRHSLDPQGNDVFVSSEHFYQTMSLWSQKVAATSSNEEGEFDRSPSRLQVIDDKELPYTHSTPRASIGDKLLKCKDLLNLSNVSGGYSLSSSRLDNTNPTDSNKTILEEEIKKLEHQLSKTCNELTITKQQLTASEEQNDMIQNDLDRLNRRLHAEQQVNEHLQKDKVLNEELREELTTAKKIIEDFKKKLSQSEKDSMYHRDVIQEQDEEKIKLEKKIEFLTKQHQDSLKEMFDIKTELETKEEQLTDVMKVYDELKMKFAEQKDFNDQVREENDILCHQKSTLEKALKAKSSNSPRPNLGNLNFSLSDQFSPDHHTQNAYSPKFSPSLIPQSRIQPKYHSSLLRRTLAHNSSTPIDQSSFLMDSSLPKSVKSLPVLSPVQGLSSEESDQRQDSSEEDLYWKLQQGGDVTPEGQNLIGIAESLHAEMHRADPVRINGSYPTALFQKDEQIIELEEELEKIRIYSKQLEDQNIDCVSKIKDQQKLNNQLIESNFILETKVRDSKEANDSLKNRLTELQRNGVIVENNHGEMIDGEIEDLKKQATMSSELDKMNADRNKLEQNLLKVEQAYKLISDEKKSLESENFILTNNLECSQSKYDHISKRLAMTEEELRELKDCMQKSEEAIRLKNEELKHLQDLQIQTNENLEVFKQNLEKKLVGEFEGKVKYSMEAEEKILNLTHKCKQLEEDLKDKLAKFSSKSRSFVEAENKIKSLGEQETSLKQEIENLKVSNTELESIIGNLKSERQHLQAELEKINKIDVVASEIQSHITDKHIVVEELKQLNTKLKDNLIKAQLDLKEKVNEILNLRNEWLKNVDIKNDLWHRVKSLQKENYKINAENRALLENERKKSNNELNIEHNNLLILYDQEVSKNTKQEAELRLLESQIEELRERLAQTQENDLTSHPVVDTEIFDVGFMKIKLESERLLEELESKLNEEVDKNRVLTKDLLELKEHLDRSNAELLEMRQKITDNEAEMVAKLQQKIENNKKLAEEFNRAKEALQSKDANLNELLNRANKAENELKLLNEQNVMLNDELSMKCEELENITQTIKDTEKKVQREIEAKNTEVLNKLTKMESLLELKQTEMECVENNNRQLVSELNITKKEKDKINRELLEATSEILLLKENIRVLQNDRDICLEKKQNEISRIENQNSNLEEELSTIKQEKETLNNKLQKVASEIIELQIELSENKKIKDTLNHELQQALLERDKFLNETKQKLQEEIRKNKALFQQFSLLKKERDRLSLELNDNNAALTDTKALYIKKQAEINELLARCSELDSNFKAQTEQSKESEYEIKESKNLMVVEISDIKSSLAEANLEIKNKEILLLATKKELGIKCLENERLANDLEEAKRNWSASFNSDGSTCSTTEKETTKRKTYARQQMAMEKLREKLEDAENQLKLEKSKSHELTNQLVLLESKLIGDAEGYKNQIERLEEELSVNEKILDKKNELAMSPEREFKIDGNNKITCEAKSVNKFTVAARTPASPDSPSIDVEVNGLAPSRKLSFHTKCPFTINCDSTIEIPSLDVNGFADDIIEELELTEGSPRKRLDREETEKNVTALTLRLLVNSNDISERIEHQTEKYRTQYEEVLSLLRDISHRLRDHVCIGTAEPIMPVFVLLEDIKMQLKEVVQTAGQVGVLIYEDRMKKCWNLVTNYMAMLRKENESLLNISSDTTSTQSGLRRRHKFTQDKADLPEIKLYRRKRISCSRLAAILLFTLGLAIAISIIIHLNCRTTASENQYCPLDGIITRINIGVPPM